MVVILALFLCDSSGIPRDPPPHGPQTAAARGRDRPNGPPGMEPITADSKNHGHPYEAIPVTPPVSEGGGEGDPGGLTGPPPPERNLPGEQGGGVFPPTGPFEEIRSFGICSQNLVNGGTGWRIHPDGGETGVAALALPLRPVPRSEICPPQEGGRVSGGDSGDYHECALGQI